MVEMSVAHMLITAGAALVLPFTLGPNLGLVRFSADLKIGCNELQDADARLTGQMVRSDE